MNTEIEFIETQRFKQWWLWAILGGINLMFIYTIFRQVIGGQPVGDNPMSNAGAIIGTAVILFITISIYFFRLETRINKDGVRVRFFPFHFAFKAYDWGSISKAYVRVYNPILEYGGWGVRMGLFGKGKAFNVSGNKGLQLVFNDGRKLLIGTSKEEQLSDTLRKLKRYKD